MKLSKTEAWILTHQTEHGTLMLPNRRKATRDAAHALQRKGLAVYGINLSRKLRKNWCGWWPTTAGLETAAKAEGR